jgi:adenylate cyclase
VLRFRSFRRRLLVTLLALTAGAQLAAFLIVRSVHRHNAEAEIGHQLATAADQLSRVIAQRTADLAKSADALAFDAGLGRTLSTTRSQATLQSALDSFSLRVGAQLVALVSLQGQVLAEIGGGRDSPAIYRPLVQAADDVETARATGYGVINGSLYSIAVVPLRSPDIVAWLAIGFRIDAPFVAELKRATGVEITIRRADAVLATTVAHPDDYVTADRVLHTATGDAVAIALQYSLREKLRPARAVETVLGAVFAGSVLVASLIALVIARGVSQPVRELAAQTRRIAAGDYSARVMLDRADELGQLSAAFNAMAAGLAERDRIRDLLDKNVSPEIAAQLLREGAALGGEEREVTVLFADLRGFTTLSEQLRAPDLLALLNRYFDRMSTEIERHGGVIDKFIGDAIMALFGAPVAQSDSADRALAAALAMQRALIAFNAELAGEDRAPLALGVGINTARVIAGNIGSHRRLNYSVIGDGVNVAARLESLTRNPEYRATIIASAATLAAASRRDSFAARPLGSVQVKGRAEPVEIHAIAPIVAV